MKIIFDGLLSVFIFLLFIGLVIGNIARFIHWIKYSRKKREIDWYYSEFWNNEWGNECTEEEIEMIEQLVKQLEEKHKETNN